MAASLRARGPDDEGLVETAWFGMAFRRLAIFAASSGRQPVSSAGGEVVLAFNGEIYNYPAIARDLAGRGVSVRSEAEALLALYSARGPDFTRRLDGDYAIAVADSRTMTCHLFRDPFGVKPLYYAPLAGGSGWAVASDPAALFLHRDFATDWDLVALAERRVLGFCASDRTNFAAVRQVPPGGSVSIRAGERGEAAVKTGRPAVAPRTAVDLEHLDDACARFLARAVRRRIEHRDEGPVVLALSGGVDSSVIAAMAAAGAPGTVQAVTIGAPGGDDERVASAVARSLGIPHRFEASTPDALLAALPRVVLAHGSQGPSYSAYFVGAAARRQAPSARILLSGEGADELFLGYWMHRDPLPYARGAASALATVPREARESSPLLGTVARWASASAPEIGADVAALFRAHQLVNQHLVPFDHGAMAHGLEGRVPYLDRALARWLRAIPGPALADGPAPKLLLRLVAAAALAGTGSERLVLQRGPSPLRAALAPARAAFVARIQASVSSSRLGRARFASLARSPEELFWLGAVEAIFLRHRAQVAGMELADLEAEVVAAAA
jgi:asparagine synthase (glutamine-hydrolysing)